MVRAKATGSTAAGGKGAAVPLKSGSGIKKGARKLKAKEEKSEVDMEVEDGKENSYRRKENPYQGLDLPSRPVWDYLKNAKDPSGTPAYDPNDQSISNGNSGSAGDPWLAERVLRLERVMGGDRNNNKKYDIPDHQLHSIYQYLYKAQSAFRALPYMARQEAVNAKMRTILVDWLAEVHHKFKLQPCTLWLTVNILDRYLEKESVKRVKLQLVGVTALFIACKCFNSKDGVSPGVMESVYITDNAYSPEEVTETEMKILSALHFEVFVPTGYHFLERYLWMIKADALVEYLAKFYAERNLQEYDILNLMPHHFAAASVYAALVYSHQCRQLQDEDYPAPVQVWPPALRRETGLTEARLVPAARQILSHVNESPSTSRSRKLNSVWKKYVMDKYMNVAQLPLPSI